MDGGILVKRLSITAGMNMNVWVHMGLCVSVFVCVGVHMIVFIMLMSFVCLQACTWGGVCVQDCVCVLTCVLGWVSTAALAAPSSKRIRGGTAEMKLIYICVCDSVVVSAMNRMRVV